MLTWHSPSYKESYNRVECSRSISMWKKVARTTIKEHLRASSSGSTWIHFLWLGMDFTCLFSRLIDSFNKPESLTTIKVCWTTTWQSLNHLFHRFSQWIDQPVCSEPMNQSINHAIGRYCSKKQNLNNYIRLFCRRWTCECVCDCFRRVHRRYWRNQHGMFVMLLCRELLVSLYIAIPWNLPTQERASH